MKKLMFVCMAALVATTASFAAPQKADAPDAPKKKIDRKHLQEVLYKRNGPMLSVPGEAQGKIVFVNAAASRVPAKWLEGHATALRAATKFSIEVTEGAFDLAAPKLVGNASLFVVDDAALPTLLLAPESAWCVLNVAPLAKGAGEKPQFFEARVKKELTRAFALLAGAQTSNYPNSLMGCITKPEDLDRFVDNVLPVDVPARFPDYVAGYGVKPDKKVSYRKACEEGWAPQPTNDVEKAIWTEIHAVPQKPMKIEFDPAKGR